MFRVMLVGLSKKNGARFEKIYKSVKVPCEIVASVETAFERITADPPALVVTEKPDNIELLYSLNTVIKTHAPVTPFLVCMSEEKSPIAIQCMKAGAYDCVARPFYPLDVLSASKRAVSKFRRTLFVEKVTKRRKMPLWPFFMGAFGSVLLGLFVNHLNGPPPNSMSLGSAHLSGLQWENRHLWVADWFESTVTQYKAKKGLVKKKREFETENIYRVRDGQPILICNTPEIFISIGSDLKIRSHHRSIELPTLHTVNTPGVNPTGLAWDGKDVWTSDSETNLLYRHGQDLRVIDSHKSIIPKPMGLSSEGSTLWVLGGGPLRVARLVKHENGYVWEGPFAVRNVLEEGVVPSGMAVHFGRLWLISGGDPRLVSIDIDELDSDWEKDI